MALQFIRKTITGCSEYWDREKKMIVVKKEDLSNVSVETAERETDMDLDKMNIEQLRSFAKQKGIAIPGNMKKVETIRNHIAEQLAAADNK